MSENQEQDTQRNFNIAVNHKNFSDSLIEILNIISKKSNDLNLDELDPSKMKNHTKLRGVCEDLKNGFKDKEGYDQGRIIKKIYKVLTKYLDKLYPEPDKSLFTLKNENDETITIIPGLNMNLVISLMDEEEMKQVWGHMYVMYISSVGMISAINSHKKEGKIWEVIPKMREKVTKMGLIFNPFVGIVQDKDDNYDVQTMFEHVDQFEKPVGPSVEDIFKLSGIDKLVDLEQLNEQLKNVKQEDVEEATSTITKMLGADNNSDVKEICSQLVGGIVEDLKMNQTTGIKDMFNTAKNVTDKIGSKLDKKKMKSTAVALSSFLKNGENNLKNMKDNEGNPIGDKIMNSLKGPLEMAQALESGKMPDMMQYAKLFEQMQGMNKGMNKKK